MQEPMPAQSELVARFQGCIVGLAVGDALGWPTEFISRTDAIKRYGPAGVTDFEPHGGDPPGTFTDDTQMSVCVARALIRAGHQDDEQLMPIMADEFVQWSRSPKNTRAPGNACMQGCHNLKHGRSWRESGLPGSLGCGSAMRSAPIGLYYWNNEPRLIEVARASSLPTHREPTAQAAAAATALLVAWAVRGDPPEEYPARLADAMERMEGGSPIASLVRKIPEVLDRAPEDVLIEWVLGLAWKGDEAVASALYCFCRSPADYRKTVLTGANTDGDSDSIACIAGAISGAHNGIDAIPEPWRTRVEDAEALHRLALELLEASRGAGD